MVRREGVPTRLSTEVDPEWAKWFSSIPDSKPSYVALSRILSYAFDRQERIQMMESLVLLGARQACLLTDAAKESCLAHVNSDSVLSGASDMSLPVTTQHTLHRTLGAPSGRAINEGDEALVERFLDMARERFINIPAHRQETSKADPGRSFREDQAASTKPPMRLPLNVPQRDVRENQAGELKALGTAGHADIDEILTHAAIPRCSREASIEDDLHLSKQAASLLLRRDSPQREKCSEESHRNSRGSRGRQSIYKPQHSFAQTDPSGSTDSPGHSSSSVHTGAPHRRHAIDFGKSDGEAPTRVSGRLRPAAKGAHGASPVPRGNSATRAVGGNGNAQAAAPFRSMALTNGDVRPRYSPNGARAAPVPPAPRNGTTSSARSQRPPTYVRASPW